MEKERTNRKTTLSIRFSGSETLEIAVTQDEQRATELVSRQIVGTKFHTEQDPMEVLREFKNTYPDLRLDLIQQRNGVARAPIEPDVLRAAEQYVREAYFPKFD